MCTSNFTFSSNQCSRVTAQHSDNWLENKKNITRCGRDNSQYTNVSTVYSVF